MPIKIKLIRSTSDSADFKKLVDLLDQVLRKRDGENHVFYDEYNKIYNLRHVALVYENTRVVACGALKSYDEKSVEIKRMFVHPNSRSKGYARLILSELEKWAVELGKNRCVLETGINYPEAISLYKSSDYQLIDNFEPYIGAENSVCFEKIL